MMDLRGWKFVCVLEPKKVDQGAQGVISFGKKKANEEGREQLKAKMSRKIEGRGRDMQGLGLLADS